MRLFIVESPAKCQKIRSYLGDGWKVIASMGHVRGLEESLDALGITAGWNPRFEILKGKTKAVKEIKDAAKGATEVWLGTDDDREGEAIAWHLCHLLKLSPDTTPRAIFHEVTETAIQASVADKNKRLNGPMVQAQFARSMLDLLVGFSISPVLWKNIAYGLSAGRCQTPALHLVFDKEMEIAGFASKQSWVYEANFTPLGFDFPIACVGTWFPQGLDEVREYLTRVPAAGKLVDVTDKTMNQSAPMPLITSSLQQECSSVYHINPKTAMMIAQQLYEAGHITYMRTDNPVLGADCLAECREFVEGKYGETYLGSSSTGGSAGGKKPKKAKKAEKEAVVQGAHEAIHPTHMELTSLPTEETWSDQHRKVYAHIWKRTLQSVMAPAQQKSRSFVFQLDGGAENEKWKGSLSMLVFKGWKILNEENDTEKEEQFAKTNELKVGMKVKWSDMVGRQIATQPPSRFSEAQLVQQLEEKGIGRPSTFASLIATILDRKYVEKKTSKGIPVDLYKLERAGPKGAVKESTVKKDVGGDKDKIHLTSLGKSVIDFVDTRFADIFAYGFTAGMEEDLDLVAHGKKERVAVLDGLWSTMKDRVGDNATGPATVPGSVGPVNTKSIKEFTLEEGVSISIANTKKGVLLIKKTPGVEKAEFAAMPPTADAATMTQEQAEALFLAKEGDSLGFLDEMPVLLKKGQYGQYVEWNGIRQSYKADTEFEALCEQLKNKTGGTQDTDSSLPTFNRQVGDYTIKRGPYGLFFYRGGAAKMIFAKFPTALAAETIGVADCAAAYKLASDDKVKSGRGGRGGFRGRGRGRGK
jgi:DNA topoisomerase I